MNSMSPIAAKYASYRTRPPTRQSENGERELLNRVKIIERERESVS